MTSYTDKPIFVHVDGDTYYSAEQGGERIVELDRKVLRQGLIPGPGTSAPDYLTFNLFNNLVLNLQTHLTEPFGENGVSWRGALSGVPDVRGYLAVIGLKDEHSPLIVSGDIILHEQRYTLSPAGDNKVRIVKAPRSFAVCGGALLSREQTRGDGVSDALYENMTPLSQDQGPVVIKVLALYPTAAKSSIPGGVPGIEAMMAKAGSATNEVFHNSKISARVEVSVRELPELPVADTQALLKAVIGKDASQRGKPLWNAVSAARDEAGASVVALLALVESWVAGAAAAVPEPPRPDYSDISYATFAITLPFHDPHTFAHELGHLLGGKHDRITLPERAPTLLPIYDYVRGYLPADKSFVTIMGYPSDHLRENDHSYGWVPAYSASDCTWHGKRLGIPFGEPDAADAAPFFRLSTQIVSRYRGTDTHSDSLVAISTSVYTRSPDNEPVDASLGGSIMPGALGPHPKGRVVQFTAMPRFQYRFDRWFLDGDDAGSSPVILVIADKPHALRARFVSEQGNFKLDVSVEPASMRETIHLSPPGGVYAPGADVLIYGGVDPLAYDYDWAVDNQPTGSIKNGIYLRMEQDHHVKVVLKDMRSLQKHTEGGLLGPNVMQPLIVTAINKRYTGFTLVGQWIQFTLDSAPDGTRLEGESRVRTGKHGIASVTLHTGQMPGKARISARLDNGESVCFEFNIASRSIVIKEGNDQYVLSGATAKPLRVQVLEKGQPAAGVKVSFSIKEEGETGLRLLKNEATTHSDGGVSVPLAGNAGRHPGKAEIIVRTADALSAISHVYVVARYITGVSARGESTDFNREDLTIQLGETARIGAVLSDISSEGVHHPSGVSVHFALDAGTTGMALKECSAATDSTGHAYVQSTPATAEGEVTATVSTAHAGSSAPLMAKIKVHVKKQRPAEE